MGTPEVTLYEVAASDGSSVSPFVWRIKLSLSRKGVRYRSCMLGLTDIRNHFDGRFETLPVVDLGDRQMNESLAIADRLDEMYPDALAIFSCPAERAMIGFFDHWLTQVIATDLLPVYALDAHDSVAPRDRAYYRRSREAYFGVTLEQLVADRETRLLVLRRSLDPVRKAIATRPYLGGRDPNFADMSMLGVFVFAGTIGTLPLLTSDDPLVVYAERGLASFGAETAALRLRLSGPTG